MKGQKRTPVYNSNHDGLGRGEWQLEGEFTCGYCGGSYKREKFTIPDAEGGFCMPECTLGYVWFFLIDDREDKRNQMESYCGRKINLPPPLSKMANWYGGKGFGQKDVLRMRYDGLSEDDVRTARAEIGHK